jgi:[ribosomal protein S5]-alanine N-acetyltransferase
MKSRVIIRAPRPADCAAFLTAVKGSRTLHAPWTSPPDTLSKYRKHLRRISSSETRGFLVIHRQTGALIGVINLNNIIRLSLRSAFLGYYAFADYARQGLMGEGMTLVLTHAFKNMKLHRLEANIQPGNTDSLKLIRRLGFVREGFSRRYLKVRGRWRDHERWAILAEDWCKRNL